MIVRRLRKGGPGLRAIAGSEKLSFRERSLSPPTVKSGTNHFDVTEPNPQGTSRRHYDISFALKSHLYSFVCVYLRYIIINEPLMVCVVGSVTIAFQRVFEQYIGDRTGRSRCRMQRLGLRDHHGQNQLLFRTACGLCGMMWMPNMPFRRPVFGRARSHLGAPKASSRRGWCASPSMKRLDACREDCTDHSAGGCHDVS